MIFNELIVRTVKTRKTRKSKTLLKLKFFSPSEIKVDVISINPERNIDKKHQGHCVFKIDSRI